MGTLTASEGRPAPVAFEMPRGGRPVAGARMRQAMEEADLSIGSVAQALAVARTTVHRWFAEDRTPEPDLLEEFAKLVGRPVEYFWKSDAQQVRTQVEAGIIRVLRRLVEQPVMPALNAVEIDIPEHRITEEERAWIKASEQTIRVQLQQLCRARYGRPFARLTSAEKSELVQSLLREAEAEE